MDRSGPVIIATIGGYSLSSTALTLSLKHIEKGDGGKEAEIVIANPDLALIDDANFQEGVEAQWRFGYMGLLSKLYKGKIYQVEPSFDGFRGLTLTLRINDAIADMRGSRRSTVWRSVTEGEAKLTESDVAEMIAAEYGYNIVSEETSLYYTEIAQSGYDFDFIANELTRTAKAKDPNKPGPYRLWFDAENTMHFEPVPLGKTPRRTFRYVTENEDPSLLSFSIRTEAYKPGDTAASETTVTDIAPDGENLEGTATNDEENDRHVMGRRTISGVTGKDHKEWVDPTIEEHGLIGPAPASSDLQYTEDHADAEAKNTQNEAELGNLKAEIKVIGDPTLIANDLVTILNVGKKYSGAYLAEEVHHEIGRQGYVTRLVCSRNADNADPNAATGTEDAEGRDVDTEASDEENPDVQRREIDGVTGEVVSGWKNPNPVLGPETRPR